MRGTLGFASKACITEKLKRFEYHEHFRNLQCCGHTLNLCFGWTLEFNWSPRSNRTLHVCIHVRLFALRTNTKHFIHTVFACYRAYVMQHFMFVSSNCIDLLLKALWWWKEMWLKRRIKPTRSVVFAHMERAKLENWKFVNVEQPKLMRMSPGATRHAPIN